MGWHQPQPAWKLAQRQASPIRRHRGRLRRSFGSRSSSAGSRVMSSGAYQARHERVARLQGIGSEIAGTGRQNLGPRRQFGCQLPSLWVSGLASLATWRRGGCRAPRCATRGAYAAPAALAAHAPHLAQCPNKSVGANMPFASKWASASSTVRKILVAVSVMNGLGFFFGFHTT